MVDNIETLKKGSVETVKDIMESKLKEIVQIHCPGEELDGKMTELKTYIDILKARIISGNNKLMDVWDELEKINDESEFKMQSFTWKNSCDKLIMLAKILMRSGFIGCLYTGRRYEEEKKYKCNSWPNGHFCIACSDGDIFWNEVIEKLPRPDRKVTNLSAENLKILEELTNEV